MKTKKYDIIYSLGTDCACANHMINFGLRMCSGPFDWIHGVGVEARVDLIVNDFANWMNIEDFEMQPGVSGEHRVYLNRRTGIIYMHDFPEGVALEESMGEVREKYERRCRRFYNEIKKARRALLIYIGRGFQDVDYVRMADMVREKLGRKVDWLVIEHHEDIDTPEYDQPCDYVKVWKMRVFDRRRPGDEEWWAKWGWAGNKELLRPVLSRYAVRIPWWRRKRVIKALCAFVPLKKWRVRLRGMIQTCMKES